MLNLDQDKYIVLHQALNHLQRFPELLLNFWVNRHLIEVGREMKDENPLRLYINRVSFDPFSLFRWQRDVIYKVHSGLAQLFSHGPNLENSQYITYKDAPEVFRFVASTYMIYPSAIFMPVNSSSGEHLKEEPSIRRISQQKFWLQYEFMRLLRPHRSLFRRLSFQLPINDSTSGMTQEVVLARRNSIIPITRVLSFSIIQALDYMHTAMLGGWRYTSRVNFYSWYEERRTVPRLTIRQINDGVLVSNLIHTYDPGEVLRLKSHTSPYATGDLSDE